VKFLQIPAHYTGDVSLSVSAVMDLKEYKRIGLYCSVQFVQKIATVVKQLEEAGHTVVTSQPDRTDEQHQILGCDVFHDNLRLADIPDVFLYVGDGQFHPRALLLMQRYSKEKVPVITWDPFAKKGSVLTVNDVRQIVVKEKANLMKFLSSDTIGVIITTKWGQQQFGYTQQLEKKYPDKQIYYFIADTIRFSDCVNYPFVEVWVNSACPRLSLDDAVGAEIAIVPLNDALNAQDVLTKLCSEEKSDGCQLFYSADRTRDCPSQR